MKDCGFSSKPPDCGTRSFKRWPLLVQGSEKKGIHLVNGVERPAPPFAGCPVGVGPQFPSFLTPKDNISNQFSAKVSNLVDKLRERSKITAKATGKRVDRTDRGFDPASQSTSTINWEMTLVRID